MLDIVETMTNDDPDKDRDKLALLEDGHEEICFSQISRKSRKVEIIQKSRLECKIIITKVLKRRWILLNGCLINIGDVLDYSILYYLINLDIYSSLSVHES